MSLDVSRDAVVIVPGFMGSELVESATGRVIWGLADPLWYVSAWTSGQALSGLAVTDADVAGASRVTATGLLRSPAFAPMLRGIEPYRDLVAGIRGVVAHPDALLEFPYDWRLSIADTAPLLAEQASAHLDRWRVHPQGRPDAQLVIVAHSMGGLVAQFFTAVLGGSEIVRATVTLGTPFYGAVKAVRVLSTGLGGPFPLPRRRLRDLAVTLPGIYDLLPTYRCVDESAGTRHLTTSDLADLGADAALADQSAAVRRKLVDAPATGLHPVVGVGQPTMQTLRTEDTALAACYYTCEQDEFGRTIRIDRLGDSTVYRDAASRPGVAAMYLPQSHSMLARSPEAIAYVKSVITQRPLGPPMSAGADETAVGVDVPDVVTVGRPFPVALRGTDPAAVSCRIRDAVTHDVVALPRVTLREDILAGTPTLVRPGIFRVEVESGSFSPVTQLILAVPENAGGAEPDWSLC